jgi:predicted SAM-dependent methyltransferase
MKHVIKKIINNFGYDLIKYSQKDDLELYDKLFTANSLKNKKFYNIGAGNFTHKYWTNIDYDSEWYSRNRDKSLSGIVFDLLSLEPIPVENNTAEIVYSSHTVEHITDQAAQNMFNESYRILKPGGLLRVTTPNIDLYYRAYKNDDRHFFFWIDKYSKEKNIKRIKLTGPMNKATIGQIFLFEFASSVSNLCDVYTRNKINDDELEKIFGEKLFTDALNYCISRCPIEIQQKYPGLHINWWNQVKMTSMLKEAGFKEIISSGYGQSISPVLRNSHLFDNVHPKISLYMEAIK